jgi:phosphoribosylanthranilate isomerase
MDPTGVPRIKICCIGSREEAAQAVAAGASAVGLVSHMPSGPGVIPEALIAEIAPTVPPGVATFLLTCLQSAGGIIDQQRRLRTNTIQICDRLTNGTYDELREALPGIKLVQVIHVGGEDSLDEAVGVAPHVDAILLDSGNQSLAVKELGGTGRRHDWAISRRIREAVGVPLYLAGGLNAENVREAIEIVGPFGIDVCSGVRTDGRLDSQKLAAFFRAIGPVLDSNSKSEAEHDQRDTDQRDH